MIASESSQPSSDVQRPIDVILQRLPDHRADLAAATPGGVIEYAQLLDRCDEWTKRLAQVRPGSVVSLEAEYGSEAIAALLAGIAGRQIVVPLSPDSRTQHPQFLELAGVEWRIDPSTATLQPTGRNADHGHYRRLRDAGHAGLVLFTSGSTGTSKAAVHDWEFLLEKFVVPRRQLRTLVFLQLDHIGGLNTLMYSLSNGGAVVVPENRSPEAVCRAIETHQVELLPTSPTFLNLLLLSGEMQRHDLSSLTRITYGTEPMPPETLRRLNEAFPDVTLQQTYGLTELGILRSKSRDSRSLWVRVGGEGYETKVVDGRLWIRARSAMLGYLNAPDPFDADGFFATGDSVEQDGEWLRILGRESEIINVGGNKVYPAEVESALLEMDNVIDAAVRGEAHQLIGQMVTATVRLADDETPRTFRARMRQYLRTRLPPYAIPARVQLTDGPLHNVRFKKQRDS